MARKAKEQEQEIDVTEKKKKETFATTWFNEHAVNNAREMKLICDMVARSAEEQFSLYIKSGNTEVYALVFYATFKTILEYLASKQKAYNEFTMEICNSINIGYTNNDDDCNEKVGNFMPILEYVGVNRNIVDSFSELDPDRTSQSYLRWKELNVRSNLEAMKTIQERAYESLKSKYKTNLRTSESVVPLFCIFIDNMNALIKMKYQEAKDTDVSEVSMNVLGLFDVFYSFDEEDDKEIISYQPNITMKLALKQDNISSRE